MSFPAGEMTAGKAGFLVNCPDGRVGALDVIII